MSDALRRCDIAVSFIEMVAGLMKDRRFFVEEGGAKSEPHPMKSGIRLEKQGLRSGGRPLIDCRHFLINLENWSWGPGRGDIFYYALFTAT